MRNPHNSMPGDWLFKVVPFFIAGVFILMVCFFVAAAILGTKAVKSLDGCTPAIVTSETNGQKQTSIECKK